MSNKKKAVLGIYKSRYSTDLAVAELKADGFSTTDISILMPDVEGSQSIGLTKTSKASEGTATGAGTGAAIGGALGLLVGIGALAIPGVGPFIAAGPIMAVMAGVGVGGAVGGVTGGLIGLGIPEFEAKRYDSFVRNGGILLSVHCDTSEEIAKAKICLERTGANDVTATSESREAWENSSYTQSKDMGFKSGVQG